MSVSLGLSDVPEILIQRDFVASVSGAVARTPLHLVWKRSVVHSGHPHLQGHR